MMVQNPEIQKVPPALTIKKAIELFGLKRYSIMKAVNDGALKIHRPNKHSYILVTEELLEWIKSS